MALINRNLDVIILVGELCKISILFELFFKKHNTKLAPLTALCSQMNRIDNIKIKHSQTTPLVVEQSVRGNRTVFRRNTGDSITNKQSLEILWMSMESSEDPRNPIIEQKNRYMKRI